MSGSGKLRYVPLEGYRHVCPECGKEFWGMASWAYKAGYKNSPVYLCSWKCLQKRRQEKKKVEELRKANRQNGGM